MYFEAFCSLQLLQIHCCLLFIDLVSQLQDFWLLFLNFYLFLCLLNFLLQPFFPFQPFPDFCFILFVEVSRSLLQFPEYFFKLELRLISTLISSRALVGFIVVYRQFVFRLNKSFTFFKWVVSLFFWLLFLLLLVTYNCFLLVNYFLSFCPLFLFFQEESLLHFEYQVVQNVAVFNPLQ